MPLYSTAFVNQVMYINFVCICFLCCLCSVCMLFQCTEDESWPPLMWQHRPPANVQISKQLCCCHATHLIYNYTNCFWAFVCTDAKGLWQTRQSWVYTFFIWLSSMVELVHFNKRNLLQPSTPCGSVWIILQTSFLNGLLVISFPCGLFLHYGVFFISSSRDTW